RRPPPRALSEGRFSWRDGRPPVRAVHDNYLSYRLHPLTSLSLNAPFFPMFSPDSLASLQKLVDQNTRFLVVSHVRPDGDAYGSTLGLALALRALGKDVRVHNEDSLSPAFEFLPGAEGLREKPVAPEADRILIAVDCADQKRLGKTFDTW